MNFIEQEVLARKELRKDARRFKKRRETLQVRLEKNLYWTISKMADREEMATSKYLDLIVQEWLKAQGASARLLSEEMKKPILW